MKMFNYNFKKMDFYSILEAVRRNPMLLKDDKNKIIFIDKSIRYSEVPILLNTNYFTLYFTDFDKAILINSLNSKDLSMVLNDVGKKNIEPELLLDKVFEYHLEEKFIENLTNNMDDILLDLIIKRTDSPDVLTLLLNNQIVKGDNLINLLNKLKSKDYCYYHFIQFLKNYKVEESAKAYAVDFLIEEKCYDALLLIVNFKIYKDSDKIINVLLETKNADIINSIELNLLDEYLQEKVICASVNYSKLEELIDFITKYNDFKFNSIANKSLYKEKRYDSIITLGTILKINEDDKVFIETAINNSYNAKKIYKFILQEKNNHYVNTVGYSLAKTNNIQYMFLYLKNVNGYSNEVKNLLINKIIESNAIKFICMLVIYVDINILTRINFKFKNKNDFLTFIVNSNLFDDITILNATKILYKDNINESLKKVNNTLKLSKK